MFTLAMLSSKKKKKKFKKKKCPVPGFGVQKDFWHEFLTVFAPVRWCFKFFSTLFPEVSTLFSAVSTFFWSVLTVCEGGVAHWLPSDAEIDWNALNELSTPGSVFF